MELSYFHFGVLSIVCLTLVALVYPKFNTYIYLGLIFFMPNTLAFGVKKGVEYISFYGAGTGLMVRPLISYYLLGLFFISLILYRNHKSILKQCRPAQIFIILSAYYAIYAIGGIASGVPINKVLSGSSAIHLVDMTLFIIILLRFCTDEKELSRLTTFTIACVFMIMCYGLIRYFFFGGDISNVYSNIEGIKIKLTFQDINDSLLACIVCYFCSWSLTNNWSNTSLRTKVFYIAVIALSIFTVLFSYRRSAWIGLCLAGVWFVFKQPMRRRIQVGIVFVVIATFMFTTLLTARLGQYEDKRSSVLFYDINNKQGDIATKSGRFSELSWAFDTIKNNLIFGVGPWGTIGYRGNRDYMHGGVMQIWLKLGLIGITLFVLAILFYITFCLTKYRKLPAGERGLFETGFAGLLFLLPTLCIGTPVIEYRTMQLLALCLALPYIIYAIKCGKNDQAYNSPTNKTI